MSISSTREEMVVAMVQDDDVVVTIGTCREETIVTVMDEDEVAVLEEVAEEILEV